MQPEVPVIEQLGNQVAAQRKVIADLLKNVGDPGVCKGCLAEIHWVVHRNGRRTPYDPTGVNHFITCPEREQFQRRKSG